MMRKNIRLIGIVVAFVLLMVAFVGCNFTPSDDAFSVTINFDSQGGSEVKSMEITKDDVLEIPADPTKEGYIFDGWYLSTDYSEVLPENFVVGESLTVYAKWVEVSEVKVVISFVVNGGTAVTNLEISPNTVATQPANPVKEGYTFDGWFTDSTCLNAFDWSTAVDEDIRLFAKWSVKTYILSFNVNGGSAVTSFEVDYNEAATQPADPTKNGYNFGGWFTDADCLNAFDWTTAFMADVELFAKWEVASYSVELHLNGGTNNGADVTNYTYGSAVVLPTEVEKANYTFGGWYDNANFSGSPVEEISSEDFGDKNYYAKWDEITIPTVVFVENFENPVWLPSGDYSTYANREVEAGQFTWSMSAYTKADSSDRVNGTNCARLRGNNSDTNNTNRIELLTYISDVVFVTFNYGSYSSHSQGVVSFYYQLENTDTWTLVGSVTALPWAEAGGMMEAKFVIPEDVRSQNLRFKIEKETNTTSSTSVSIDDISINFDAEKFVLLTFDTDGGSYLADMVVEKNTVVNAPENPTKDLHMFEGWFTSEGNAFDWELAIGSSTTIIAHWTEYSVTNISINSDNTKKSFYADEDFEIDIILTAIYSNLDEVDIPASDYANNISITHAENGLITDFLNAPAGIYYVEITFEGKTDGYEITKLAEVKPQFTVGFDLNYDGCVNPETQTLNLYDKIVIANPTRENFTFIGWYFDEECTQAVDIANYTVSQNVVLYAGWSDKIVVDFDNWAGTLGYASESSSVHGGLTWSAQGYRGDSGSDRKAGSASLRFRGRASDVNYLRLDTAISNVHSISFIYGSYGSHSGGTVVLSYSIDGAEWFEIGKVENIPSYSAMLFVKFDLAQLITNYDATQAIYIKLEKVAVSGSTSVNIDNFTLWFTAPQISLVNISIDDAAVKKEFEEGDALDTTGLVVTASYDNGIDTVLTEGYTVSVLDSLNAVVSDFVNAVAGTYTVQIAFEGKTASYTIVLEEKALVPVYHVVTFNQNFEGAPNATTQNVLDEAFAQNVVPARNGFKFIGWFTDAECTTQFLVPVTPITQPVTLYAMWIDGATSIKQDFSSWNGLTYGEETENIAGGISWAARGYTGNQSADHFTETPSLRLRSNRANDENYLVTKTAVTGVSTLTFDYGSYGTHDSGTLVISYSLDGINWTVAQTIATIGAWDEAEGMKNATVDFASIEGFSSLNAIFIKIEKVLDTSSTRMSINIDNVEIIVD